MSHQYPIGKFEYPGSITSSDIKLWIQEIEQLPNKLITVVSNLTDEQLDTPYRTDGWTARQVIHHIYDSHHNSYIRFKWALTEDRPVIKAYHEDRWAELFDYKTTPVQISINSIQALHAKWVYLLKGLSDKDLKREFIHPETKKAVSLEENIGMYAWHGNHHLAHLQIVAGM